MPPSSTTAAEPTVLFQRDGDVVVPTAAALGPWRPDSLHGGPVAALLAGAMEHDGFVLGRVLVDFLGRVPSQPLRLDVHAPWGWGRLRRQSAELWADDRLVARAQGLRLPESDIDLPADAVDGPELDPPVVDDAAADARKAVTVDQIGWPSFASHAIDRVLRSPRGGEPDAATMWVRLLLPVVAGEPLTGVQRAAAAADLASHGTAMRLPFREWSFSNADLSVHLARRPLGEWVALTSTAVAQRSGVGIGEARLADAHGPIGRATQTLLLEPRQQTPPDADT